MSENFYARASWNGWLQMESCFASHDDAGLGIVITLWNNEELEKAFADEVSNAPFRNRSTRGHTSRGVLS